MSEEEWKRGVAIGLLHHTEIKHILNGPRVGQVDGIRFSLVHSELPSSDEWICVNPHFPEIVFPWQFSGSDAEFEKEWLPGCDIRQTRIRQGDCIEVWRVERQKREGIFPVNDPHDAFVYLADLVVFRDGETAAFIDEQLVFIARDALGAFSPMHSPFDRNDNYEDAFRITFEKVRQRINRLGGRSLIVPQSPTGYFGWVNDTGEIRPLTVSEAKDVTAGIMPPHLSKFAKESRAGWPGTAWEETAILVSNEFDQALWAGFSRRSMLDLATAAGYALAQAEMELGIKPLALSALKMKNSGAKGGAKRAANRQAWVSENWEPHALELAQSTRAKNPHISQPDLATEVLCAWKIEVELPSHSWTLNFIREAERQNRLEKRKSKVGPRG